MSRISIHDEHWKGAEYITRATTDPSELNDATGSV